MGTDFTYDPVTAIDEASATGETAEIFADIRQTMGIPLVTSIWRGLAGMGDSLPNVWAIAKPLYESGLPEAALARLIGSADLPVPEPLAPTQLACVGVGSRELATISAVIAAYNRSNGMNMVALAALVTAAGRESAPESAPQTPLVWPELPPLLEQAAIAPDTWALIRHVNAFGSPGIDANVATLWRHLAHWPGLLALIHAGLAPQHSLGAITAATAQVVELAREEGARMAHLRQETIEMSDLARETITGYVRTPTQVVRMVTLGHALAKWLEQN